MPRGQEGQCGWERGWSGRKRKVGRAATFEYVSQSFMPGLQGQIMANVENKAWVVTYTGGRKPRTRSTRATVYMYMYVHSCFMVLADVCPKLCTKHIWGWVWLTWARPSRSGSLSRVPWQTLETRVFVYMGSIYNTAQETQGNNFYACFPDSYIQPQRDWDHIRIETTCLDYSSLRCLENFYSYFKASLIYPPLP